MATVPTPLNQLHEVTTKSMPYLPASFFPFYRPLVAGLFASYRHHHVSSPTTPTSANAVKEMKGPAVKTRTVGSDDNGSADGNEHNADSMISHEKPNEREDTIIAAALPDSKSADRVVDAKWNDYEKAGDIIDLDVDEDSTAIVASEAMPTQDEAQTTSDATAAGIVIHAGMNGEHAQQAQADVRNQDEKKRSEASPLHGPSNAELDKQEAAARERLKGVDQMIGQLNQEEGKNPVWDGLSRELEKRRASILDQIAHIQRQRQARKTSGEHVEEQVVRATAGADAYASSHAAAHSVLSLSSTITSLSRPDQVSVPPLAEPSISIPVTHDSQQSMHVPILPNSAPLPSNFMPDVILSQLSSHPADVQFGVVHRPHLDGADGMQPAQARRFPAVGCNVECHAFCNVLMLHDVSCRSQCEQQRCVACRREEPPRPC